MAKKKKRRHFSPEDKVAVIKEVLVDKVPVSEVCDKHDIGPSHFYNWQKKFFENGAEAFRPKKADAATRRLKKKVDKLTKKLSTKDEVIAEIGEEYVKLKKELGEP
jgi:transposase-like protein